MTDQLSSAGLLSATDKDVLELLRTRRNKAAHPSGVHASAEEARFVFFEVIDKFLSKKALSTTQAVDALISRLDNANLFPSANIIDIAAVTTYETSSIHPLAMTQLIAKLTPKCGDANAAVSRNSKFLLYGWGVRKLAEDEVAIRKHLITLKSDDELYAHPIAVIIARTSDYATDRAGCRSSRKKLLTKTLTEIDKTYAVSQPRHPVFLLAAILQVQGYSIFESSLSEWFELLINKFTYTPSLVNSLKDHSTLFERWLTLITDNAGSSTFDTANLLASRLSELDEVVGASISPARAYELLLAIDRGASNGDIQLPGPLSGPVRDHPKHQSSRPRICERPGG